MGCFWLGCTGVAGRRYGRREGRRPGVAALAVGARRGGARTVRAWGQCGGGGGDGRSLRVGWQGAIQSRTVGPLPRG